MAFASRMDWVRFLFPSGIPQQWCPPLTHFMSQGRLAKDRIAVHLRHIGRHAQGWLIPGSTGEGWQMNDKEVRDVLDCALSVAKQVDARVLVGVLRQDASSCVECIEQTLEWLCKRANTGDPHEALVAQHICGFTVCPPTGKNLSDEQIGTALRKVLQLNVPTALYQLPQVTQNEMSPKLIAELAEAHPNFVLFKDTSGFDRVAQSDVDVQDLYLVRGAEGKYANWLKSADGKYDGFLLSTANAFSDRYAAMIDLLNTGNVGQAREAISPVEHAVAKVFEIVGELSSGNAFANANKAMDHFMAFGDGASMDDGPYLYDGQQIPPTTLEATREILRKTSLLPDQGYLTEA